MADETKKYLVNVEDNLSEYAKRAANAKKEVDDLKESNKTLKDSGKASVEQIEKSNASLKVAQEEYKKAQKLVELQTKVINSEAGSRKQLGAMLDLERQKLGQLGSAYTTNEKGIRTLNPLYVDQRNKISSLAKEIQNYDKSLGDGRSSIGLYAQEIGTLIPGFSGVESKAKSFISVIGKIGPYGVAAFVALGAAIAPILSYFKFTEEGADMLERKMSGFKASMDVLKGKVAELGREMIGSGEKTTQWGNILQGALKGVMNVINAIIPGSQMITDSVVDATNKTAEAMNKAAVAGEAYAKSQEANEWAEIGLIKSRSEATLKIKEARLAYADTNKPLEERIGYLAEALKLEGETADKEITVAQKEYDDLVLYNNHLKEQGLFKRENAKQEEEAYAKITNLQSDSVGRQVRAANTLNKARKELLKEAEDAEKEAAEKQQKIWEEANKKIIQDQKDRIDLEKALAKGDFNATKKALLDEYNWQIGQINITDTQKLLLNANFDAAIAALDVQDKAKKDAEFDKEISEGYAMQDLLYQMRLDGAEADIALTQRVLDEQWKALQQSERWQKMTLSEQLKANNAYTKSTQSNSKKIIDQKKQELQAYASIAGSMSQLLGQQTQEGKGFAVAQAIINTYLSASQAMAEPGIPYYLKVINMVAAIVAGLANVKQIMSVDTNGTSTATSISSTATPQHVTAQMATTQGTTILQSGSITQAAGTAQTATAQSLTADDIANAVGNLPAPVVTVEDINAKIKSAKKVTFKANI
jgi:hypothetical protein